MSFEGMPHTDFYLKLLILGGFLLSVHCLAAFIIVLRKFRTFGELIYQAPLLDDNPSVS